MRVRVGGSRTPPHKAAGILLIFCGGMIMLIAMPIFVYAAVLGGLIAYVGHTLRNR